MFCKAAESTFQKGLREFKNGHYQEALIYFEAALQLDKKYHKKVMQAKYLSYYGLCLSIATNNVKEGIYQCKKAIELEFYNADLFHNLGLVYLLSGKRKEAHLTFMEGLKIQKNHREIHLQLKKMGMRQRPPFPFLPRSHFLNRVSGKILSSLKLN